MKKDPIETIKDWHVRLCIAVLTLFSIFIFALGLRLVDTVQPIPWWFALIYGWSGLVVAIKLGDIWYKDKKD